MEILEAEKKLKSYTEDNICIEFNDLRKAIETVLADRERLMNKLEMFSKQNIEYSKTLENLQKNTIWKDKIIAKLDELEIELKDEKYTHDMYEGTIKYDEYLGLVAKHNILKELLEEE